MDLLLIAIIQNMLRKGKKICHKDTDITTQERLPSPGPISDGITSLFQILT